MHLFCSMRIFEDDTILKPRIPMNRMNAEEKVTPRICTSQSIDGCLTALCGFDEHDIIHVYECRCDTPAYSPSIEEVADVIFTGEEWFLSDTKIKLLMTIRITKVIERKINEMYINTFCYELVREEMN